jgi:hypothetical protein
VNGFAFTAGVVADLRLNFFFFRDIIAIAAFEASSEAGAGAGFEASSVEEAGAAFEASSEGAAAAGAELDPPLMASSVEEEDDGDDPPTPGDTTGSTPGIIDDC